MAKHEQPVVVVTGGSRGIGRAIVRQFIADGAAVVACARGARPANLTDDVMWVTADVSRADDVSRLVRETLTRHGRIDVLVNNAGVQVERTLPDTTDEDWDAVMSVNAKGVFLCCRATIPPMKAQGRGVIVNIGSISGMQADPALALYNASKAFVHGLTRSIAVDHGPDGIRCNAVCPGWIETDMAGAAFDMAQDPAAARRDALRRHPVGRLGTPEDVASLVVWLASARAGFITGQAFVVDGGLIAASPLQPRLF